MHFLSSPVFFSVLSEGQESMDSRAYKENKERNRERVIQHEHAQNLKAKKSNKHAKFGNNRSPAHIDEKGHHKKIISSKEATDEAGSNQRMPQVNTIRRNTYKPITSQWID